MEGADGAGARLEDHLQVNAKRFGLGSSRQKYGLGGAVDGEGGYLWGGANGTQFWIHSKERFFAIFMVQTHLYKAPTYPAFRALANEAAGISLTGDLGAAGESGPAGNAGVNLLPFLSGEEPGRPHETLFWRMRDMQASVVRHGDWKYMNVRGSVSLFNLKNDPWETNDLAASQPQVINELATRFAAWDKKMAEPLWAFPAEERAERRKKRRDTGGDE